MSTEAETDNPQTELKPGIDLLGPVEEIFFDIYDRYEPVNEPVLDNCFISTVSHVQALVSIFKFYKRCTLDQCLLMINRVMMQQHTLSPLSWMCSTCIP